MKHKQNDLIITDDFFKELPKSTIVESPPLADERVKFCAEINRLNRENEELRANQIKGRCITCEWATHDNTRCEDPIIEFKIDTETMGYCHRWEARENE